MTKENRFDTKEWTAPVIEKIPAWVADTEDVAILLTDREKMEWEIFTGADFGNPVAVCKAAEF